MVPSHCVDVFVIPHSSRSDVLLFLSMVGVDDLEGPG